MMNDECGMRNCRLLYLLFLWVVAMPCWAWRAWPLPMDSVDNNRDTLCYYGEFMGLASSGKFAPFLMSTNTDGVVGVSPFSAYLRGGIEKKAVRQARWWDYSYGAQIVVGGQQSTVNSQQSMFNGFSVSDCEIVCACSVVVF